MCSRLVNGDRRESGRGGFSRGFGIVPQNVTAQSSEQDGSAIETEADIGQSQEEGILWMDRTHEDRVQRLSEELGFSVQDVEDITNPSEGQIRNFWAESPSNRSLGRRQMV